MELVASPEFIDFEARAGKLPNGKLPILGEKLQTFPFGCRQKYLRAIHPRVGEERSRNQCKTSIPDRAEDDSFTLATMSSRTRCDPSNVQLKDVTHCSGSLLG